MGAAWCSGSSKDNSSQSGQRTTWPGVITHSYKDGRITTVFQAAIQRSLGYSKPIEAYRVNDMMGFFIDYLKPLEPDDMVNTWKRMAGRANQRLLMDQVGLRLLRCISAKLQHRQDGFLGWFTQDGTLERDALLSFIREHNTSEPELALALQRLLNLVDDPEDPLQNGSNFTGAVTELRLRMGAIKWLFDNCVSEADLFAWVTLVGRVFVRPEDNISSGYPELSSTCAEWGFELVVESKALLRHTQKAGNCAPRGRCIKWQP
ncbi:hypothetical protein JKP88DRAFT_245852 [Tribonema minus]|uniref:Uncharacterized protein n=1 Tax=Tribonema minus TaxID=303371 RepID=A0A835YV49_9STRA|nr:hypothetical protein JKP88DRAFT_245852 [Tribonema minus]